MQKSIPWLFYPRSKGTVSNRTYPETKSVCERLQVTIYIQVGDTSNTHIYSPVIVLFSSGLPSPATSLPSLPKIGLDLRCQWHDVLWDREDGQWCE